MKNSRKRESALVASGIILGVAIAGPAAHAAEEILTAQRSTQKIYVDGQQVQMEAYSISGNNYVKLRDIGKTVDFSVTYSAVTFLFGRRNGSSNTIKSNSLVFRTQFRATPTFSFRPRSDGQYANAVDEKFIDDVTPYSELSISQDCFSLKCSDTSLGENVAILFFILDLTAEP